MEEKIVEVPLENLFINLDNPRHVPQQNQRDAIAIIAHEQGNKLINLAEDIVEKGLSPSELPLVIPYEKKNEYIVLEGNRRIIALKLLTSPELLYSIGLRKNLYKRFSKIASSAGGNIPKKILCAITNREDATHWMHLKHTGENEGIGIVAWDGLAKQRFRGSSPALQVIEKIEKSNLIDEDTKKKLPKIFITNIERILGTPDARRELGVNVKKNKLFFVSDETDALKHLAIVVTDVANRLIRVSDLDTKDQRIAYAKDVASRYLTLSNRKKQPQSELTGEIKKTKIKIERKTLIPYSLKLTIPQIRINKIYHELQKIDIKYINCCAVLFRVFVELSIDYFAKTKSIELKTLIKKASKEKREMHLREKIKTIFEYMEKNHIADKKELRGIRALYSNRDHCLSVDSLNAYIHNMHFNPIASELKSSWDNIQVFIEKIWMNIR